ncbi:MAG: hypothetical protein RSC93_09925 [Erysipelotrichaceae bacterium]
MKIKSNIKDYEVKIEKNDDFLYDLHNIDNSLFVIDRNVYKLYYKYFSRIPNESMFLIDATEDNKTIETALKICDEFMKIPAKRNATMITIGGGICQDITGFAANILYRGVNWILVPTTLLSACDSCIGSKTSLNYKKYKNLLGTFYPPNELHIYSEFFKTLTDRDFQSGLGEVVKFNVMRGTSGINNLENKMQLLLNRDKETIDEFVLSSLEFKRPFIESDEFDKGNRISLNFAHTFGHAIESVSNYVIPHGTAVAIGMLMANYISERKGLISLKIRMRIEKLTVKIINVELRNQFFNEADIIEAMGNDKKRKGKKLAAVLLDSKFDTIVHYDLENDDVISAINYILDLMKGINYNENKII